EQSLNIFSQHRRPEVVLRLVTILYVSRKSLGFHFLSPWEVGLVQRMLMPVEFRQTPCIPWRIWEYQKDRLHEFMSDFISASDRIVRLTDRLIELYKESDYSR